MNAVHKNIVKCFAKSKTLCNIAEPNRRRFFESKTNIRSTADKAGFFFGRFLFGEFDGLATFQKSLASFVIYIQQIFVSKMPNRYKDLQSSDKIAVSATANARNSVIPLYKQTGRLISCAFLRRDAPVRRALI